MHPSLPGGLRVTRIAIIITGAIGLALAGTVTAAAAPRTLTVAKDGTGTYTTIQAAATAALPGDTVEIAGGVYVEAVRPAASGTAAAPITYRARGTDTVVIDGQKRLSSTNGLVNLDGRSFITMSGITVTNSPRHGIYGYQVSAIRLDGMTVTHTLDGGVVFVTGSDVDVSGSEIAWTNERGTSASNEALTVNNINRFEIQDNRVHDCGEEGIDAKYGATNGSIHDNVVTGNRGPNIYLDAATRVRVYNNVARGATNSTKAGIMLAVERYASTKVLDQIDVYNNTLIGNQGSGVVIWKEKSNFTISNIRIVNNVMYGNSKNALAFTAAGGYGGTNVVRNNIMTGNTLGPTSGASSGFTFDHNLTTGDPMFVDADGGDLHLRTGSPAIDTGSAALAPATDAAGTPRPQGAGFDMGVYER